MLAPVGDKGIFDNGCMNQIRCGVMLLLSYFPDHSVAAMPFTIAEKLLTQICCLPRQCQEKGDVEVMISLNALVTPVPKEGRNYYLLL